MKDINFEFDQILKSVKKNGNQSFIILGGIIALSTVGYLLWRKKNKTIDGFYAGNSKQKMFFFNVAEGGSIHRISAEQTGKCYKIRVAGRPVGIVFKDANVKAGWRTNNTGLADKMPIIGPSLSQAISRISISNKLKTLIPSITNANWKGADTLEVVLNQNSSIEDFEHALKPFLKEFDDLHGLVDLMVKLPHEDYFKIIQLKVLSSAS